MSKRLTLADRPPEVGDVVRYIPVSGVACYLQNDEDVPVIYVDDKDITPRYVSVRDKQGRTIHSEASNRLSFHYVRRADGGSVTDEPVMVICPNCEGDMRGMSLRCGILSFAPVICWLCKGANVVTQEQAQRFIEGQRQREDRVKRGVSQREEARALGITPQELNDIEFGRVRQEGGNDGK